MLVALANCLLLAIHGLPPVPHIAQNVCVLLSGVALSRGAAATTCARRGAAPPAAGK